MYLIYIYISYIPYIYMIHISQIPYLSGPSASWESGFRRAWPEQILKSMGWDSHYDSRCFQVQVVVLGFWATHFEPLRFELTTDRTVSSQTKNLDFGGLDPSRFLIARGRIPRSAAKFPETQAQGFLVCGLNVPLLRLQSSEWKFTVSREIEPVRRSFCRRRSCTFTKWHIWCLREKGGVSGALLV